MIGFYSLLAGNKARTQVLPLHITRARSIYWSADMSADLRAKPVYHFGSLPPIKYQLSAITRGGVEDTRLEAKAKDTKKIRGQGQPFRGQTLSRTTRGQGQGPRTQPQVFSKKKKKKGLQKSFSGNLQFKGLARIFDWGGLNHKSHAMTSSNT